MSFARIRTHIWFGLVCFVIGGISLLHAQTGFLTFPLQDSSTPVFHGWLYNKALNASSYHGAVDLKAPQNTPVLAAADGLAISSCQPPLMVTDPTLLQFGNFVLIDHRNGFSTLYAHLNSINISNSSKLPCDNSSRFKITSSSSNINYLGQIYTWTPVRRGDVIGTVGNSGTVYFHLHFEIAKDSTGSYATHAGNANRRIDAYDINDVAPFYPPPAQKCSNVQQPPDYLWTACPPLPWNQTSGTAFMKTLGTSLDDFASSIQPTSDGGFIVAGYTRGAGIGREDLILVKLDSTGNITSANAAGTAGSDIAYSVRQTADGGYAVGGSTDGATGVFQMMLSKFDSTGAPVWTSTLGNTSDSAGAFSAQPTSDGGYIVTGFPGGGNWGLGLLKYSSTGQLQWISRTPGPNHYGLSVQQTSEGGYIVAGNVQIGGSQYDVSLLKFDASGNLQWAQDAGGPADESANSVQQTSDGGYIVTGTTASYGAGGQDVFLLKYASTGTLTWARTAGGTGNDVADSVRQTTDGGYVVSGRTTSFGTGAQNVLLLKFDSSGGLTWARSGGGSTSSTSVQQTVDGGYFVAGSTANFGAGGSDVLLIRTDANGNIAGCADWSSVSPTSGTTFQSTGTTYTIDPQNYFAIGAPTLSGASVNLTPNTRCGQ